MALINKLLGTTLPLQPMFRQCSSSIEPSDSQTRPHMCNFYSQTKSQDAIRQLFDNVREDGEELVDTTGNLAPQSVIWSDYFAPIIQHAQTDRWQISMARWSIHHLSG